MRRRVNLLRYRPITFQETIPPPRPRTAGGAMRICSSATGSTRSTRPPPTISRRSGSDALARQPQRRFLDAGGDRLEHLIDLVTAGARLEIIVAGTGLEEVGDL